MGVWKFGLIARSLLATSIEARRLSSLSFGKQTMKGKLTATPCRAFLRAREDLLELDVLLDPVDRLLRTRLDPDDQSTQTRAAALGHHLFRKTLSLVGAHRGRPGDRQLACDQLVGDGLDAVGVGEVGLVLEVHVVEAVTLPEPLELLADPDRLETHPLSPVDVRVGAERAAEEAPLRGDVVELPLPFEREVPLDREDVVVVRLKAVDVAEDTRRVLHRLAIVPAIGAAGAAVERAPVAQSLQDLGERLFPLSLHRDVDAGLLETTGREERGMPAPPDDREIRIRSSGSARDRDGVVDRGTRQDGDSEAESAFEGLNHRAGRIALEPSVDQDDVVPAPVQMGRDRQRPERHGEEDRPGIVENDAGPIRGCAARIWRRERHHTHSIDRPVPAS
jgi:hypothetical protein